HLAASAFSAPAWLGTDALTNAANVSGESPLSARPADTSPEIASQRAPGEPPMQPTFAPGPLWGALLGAASGSTRTPWERGERARGAAAGFHVPTPGAHEQFQTTGRLPALRVLGQ